MQRLTITAISFVVLETKELPYLTGTTVLFLGICQEICNSFIAFGCQISVKLPAALKRGS